MKERELREHSRCGACGELIGRSGVPAFHILKIETYQLDGQAIVRQDGLAAMMGSPTLAMVMGPDAHMADEVGELKATLCHACYARLHKALDDIGLLPTSEGSPL